MPLLSLTVVPFLRAALACRAARQPVTNLIGPGPASMAEISVVGALREIVRDRLLQAKEHSQDVLLVGVEVGVFVIPIFFRIPVKQ